LFSSPEGLTFVAFLLAGINAEMSTYTGQSPLASALLKTREALLDDILSTYDSGPTKQKKPAGLTGILRPKSTAK